MNASHNLIRLYLTLTATKRDLTVLQADGVQLTPEQLVSMAAILTNVNDLITGVAATLAGIL